MRRFTGVRNTLLPHFIDLRQVASLKKPSDEWRWSDSTECYCYCYLRNVQDLQVDGKTPYERRFGEPFKGTIIPFRSNGWISSDFDKRSIKIFSIWQEKITSNFLGHELTAGGIWKGDVLVADNEDLENIGASDIYPRRIKAKELLISQKDDEFIFPKADGTAKLSGRDYKFRVPSLRREQLVRSEDLRGEIQGESGVSTGRTNRWRWSLCRFFFLGRFKVTSSIVITKNFEFNSTCRMKKHSLFHWNTLMLQGLHFLIRMCYTRKGLMTKNETPTRPDYVCPEVWTKIGKAAQNREKQEWAKEEPKLDNVRKLRGIYFLDPDDREYSEILKNARSKFCKTCGSRDAIQKDGQDSIPVSRMWCKIMAMKRSSKQCVIVLWNLLNPRDSEQNLCSLGTMDHIAGKGFTSMTHYNLVHMFIPMPQAMKIFGCQKLPWTRNGRTRDNSGMGIGKSQEQEGGYSGSTKRQKESPLCYTDGHTSPQERGVRTQI